MPSNIVATAKKSYQKKFQDLCDRFIKKTNGSIFLKKHTELVDSLLVKLWIDSDISKKKYADCRWRIWQERAISLFRC